MHVCIYIYIYIYIFHLPTQSIAHENQISVNVACVLGSSDKERYWGINDILINS